MRSGTESAGELPFTATGGGLRLRVRLTPRAARNGFDGLMRGSDGRTALKLRVVAPPMDGAANAALVAYLAEVLMLRKSDVRVVSGGTARLKVLELSGDTDLIAARLDQWIAASCAGERV